MPQGVKHFEHFISETGFVPRDLGVRDPAAAARAKAKYILRAPMFWLNKGISAIDLFQSWAPDPLGYGYLAADGGDSPALQTLRRAHGFFGDAKPLGQLRQLGVDLAALSPQKPLFGDPSGQGAALYDRDLVAILPFQADTHRFVVGIYVMTMNFPQDLAPEPYELTFSGVDGKQAQLRYYDPLEDHSEPALVTARAQDQLTVRLYATETPRLLEIHD
jgi:hypothetical protein